MNLQSISGYPVKRLTFANFVFSIFVATLVIALDAIVFGINSSTFNTSLWGAVLAGSMLSSMNVLMFRGFAASIAVSIAALAGSVLGQLVENFIL